MVLAWDRPIRGDLKAVEEEVLRSIQSKEPLLTEISLHVISSGGKRIRPGVGFLAFRSVGGTDIKTMVRLASAFEIIHSATLIHDDINDGGEARRGKISAYKKYGLQKALVAGDFLFVKGFQLGSLVQNETLINIVAEACASMAESEILQAEHNREATTLERYLRIIEGKTAKPIEASAMVGAFIGKGSGEQIDAMADYGLNIGYAFQIIDDILDLDGDERILGKPKGMDYMDGKATLPMMYAMESSGGGRMIELFAKESKTWDDAREFLNLIHQTNAIDRARRHAEQFRNKAIAQLEHIAQSEFKDALIRLANAIIERKA